MKKFQEPELTLEKNKTSFTPLILEQNTLFNSKQPVLRINYTSGVSIDFFGTVDTGYLKDLCQ
jgi:hypothetical protein